MDEFLFDFFDSQDEEDLQLLNNILEQQIHSLPLQEKLTHENPYIQQLGLKELHET